MLESSRHKHLSSDVDCDAESLSRVDSARGFLLSPMVNAPENFREKVGIYETAPTQPLILAVCYEHRGADLDLLIRLRPRTDPSTMATAYPWPVVLCLSGLFAGRTPGATEAAYETCGAFVTSTPVGVNR